MTAPAPPDLTHGPEWAALELLCHPASTQGRDEGIHALLASRDLHWGELIEQAIRHKLLPLLAGHLADRPYGDLVARPLATHMRQAFRSNQHRTRIYRAEALRVTTALAAAGVPVAVTGALALEPTIYAGEGTRNFTDLDLLIAPTLYQRASDILTKLGYQPARPGIHLRRIEDPIAPTLVVDVATSLPPGTSRTTGTAVDTILNRRYRQPLPGRQSDAGLPVLATTDLALTHVLTWSRKAWHGDDLTLLALADLLRLWTTTPDLRRPVTLEASPLWTAARHCTPWMLAVLDQIFGTTLIDQTGSAPYLAATDTYQEHVPQPDTVRERMHAKRHPSRSQGTTTGTDEP